MATSPGLPVIEVDDLHKSFTSGRRARQRTVDAVAGISFAVGAGERLAYIGPNGAGKSTSIKMLTGILHPDSGVAHVLGHVPWRERKQVSRRIGTLFGQRSQLWAELAPRASLRMLAAILGLDDATTDRRVAELGELLEATDLLDVPVRHQSLGQRMRCELAACLLHDPEILFLDEPTIGLDLLAKQRFRQMLVTLNRERGTTVFLTSHDVADIETVAERAIVVNHGSVIRDAPVESMRRGVLATKSVAIGLERPVDAAAVASITGTAVDCLEHTDLVIRLRVDTRSRSIRDVIDDVLDHLPVADLSVVDPPLEEVIAGIYDAPAPR